jgi:ribosomal protein RSM22 (predicted rRNA methylase)
MELPAVSRVGRRGRFWMSAGPGSALWATADCRSSVEQAVAVEQCKEIRDTGANLAAKMAMPISWRQGDASKVVADKRFDIATLAYVLGEVSRSARPGR